MIEDKINCKIKTHYSFWGIFMTTPRKRHIQWLEPKINEKILQIYSKGVEFALVSENYEQCHSFVWCKDFLHDAVYSTLNNKPIEIYRFKFNPTINPNPCLKSIKLLLANSKDKKFKEKIPACLDFINQIEEQMKIKKTIIKECDNIPNIYKNSGVFLFEGSKRWIQAPPMISLYSLLLRVGFSHIKGTSFKDTIDGIYSKAIKPYQKNDRKWLMDSELALEKILRLGDRKVFYRNIKENYPNKFTIDIVHNKLGIIGFSTDILLSLAGASVVFPSWHLIK